MQYVLASASPRRKELLQEILPEFEIVPSAFDEAGVQARSPARLVRALAKGKAADVAMRSEHAGKIVLGSDTIVVYGREVLGKPKDEADARRMLKMLSGKKQYVYTGVCLAAAQGGVLQQKSAACKTAVYFQELSDEWITEYIASGSPMDKAGAYGIQDGGLVKKIKGSYSNVVGLPTELVKKMINKAKKQG